MRKGLQRLALVVAVALAAGGGAALATRGGDPATIQACRNVTNGALRVVDDPAQCRQHEVPLEWASGGATPSVQIVTASHEFSVDDPAGYVTATCPSGTTVVGGGWSLGADNSWATQSFPVESPQGWRIYAGLLTAIRPPDTATVYAVCLS